MDSPQCIEFVSRYVALGFSGKPCSQEEVAFLERKYRVRLPLAYRAFLLLMGQSPDPYFDGSDCRYRWLPELRAAAAGLLVESGNPFALPPQAFVFTMEQGYQFMYFLCDGVSEDPAVFHYLENEPTPKLVYNHFSEWMEACAQEKRERATRNP